MKDNFKNLNKVIIKREAKLSENVKNASALGEPLIYIYNTHQTEEYAPGSLKIIILRRQFIWQQIY